MITLIAINFKSSEVGIEIADSCLPFFGVDVSDSDIDSYNFWVFHNRVCFMIGLMLEINFIS